MMGRWTQLASNVVPGDPSLDSQALLRLGVGVGGVSASLATSLSSAPQTGSSQSKRGKGTLLRKLWPRPCREEPILGHPDEAGAALLGAYKYVSSGYWSAPGVPTSVWRGGRPSKPADG